MELDAGTEKLTRTATLVAAYLEHNKVPRASLPDLIATVGKALGELKTAADVGHAEMPLQPAVSRKRSVFPSYIVCLDDGKRFKSLKRHLSAIGMTPDEYRAKWRLPSDYPMVAPEYSAARSALAKKIGLGSNRSARKKSTKPAAKR